MLEKIRTYLVTQLAIIYMRYLIGGAFVFASIIKIKGLRFTTTDGTNAPIDTPWHFFEMMYQSGLYWQFLGWGQLIAGGLLMTQRFAKLGVIAFFPIIANVFMITISYDFGGTSFVTGGMLLATLVLLVWDFDTFKILLNIQPSQSKPLRTEKQVVWEITGWALFLFTVIYKILHDKYDIILWFGICSLISIIGLLIGLIQWKKIN